MLASFERTWNVGRNCQRPESPLFRDHGLRRVRFSIKKPNLFTGVEPQANSKEKRRVKKKKKKEVYKKMY